MFGIDVNEMQNQFSGQQQQPANQYQQSRFQSSPDNTSWMAPSGNNDSTLSQDNTQNGSGYNWLAPNNGGGLSDTSQPAQAPQSSIQPGDGTAISAVNNGWQFQQNPPIPPAAGYGSQFDQHDYVYSGSQFNQTDPGRIGYNDPGQQWWNKGKPPDQWSSNPSPDFGPGSKGDQGQPTYGGTPNQQPSGNVGQYMPSGYDQGKFSDPNKHDPKYDTGRILSKYPPGPAGLDQAMPELSQAGYKRVGKDSIYRDDVGTIDVGRAFSTGDPNQMKWDWMPAGDGSQQSFGGTPQYQQQQYQQPQQVNLPVSSQLQRQRYARLRNYGNRLQAAGPTINPNQAMR